MSNSNLVTYTKISPNKNSPRNNSIDRITIHCYVGQVTAEQGCNSSRFVKYDANNGASCNYVVGKDGTVGLCVEEKDRSWCSSNSANDNRAVTIEVASDSFHPYKVTDLAYNKLIELVTDICRRNGKTKIIWFGDKDKTLNYEPKENEMVMTVHRWFAAKACPGDYLYNLHNDIANKVNQKLNGDDEEVTLEQFKDLMNQYRNELRDNDASSYSEKAREWAKEKELIAGGSADEFNGMWEDFLTREQFMTVLYRFAEMIGKL